MQIAWEVLIEKVFKSNDGIWSSLNVINRDG